MDRWEVKPLISVGEIKFGMDRTELHALFEEKCEVFKKSKYSKNTTDAYKRFHVYYTPDDTVEAVEFIAGEGIELILNGVVIFPIKIAEIEKAIPGMESDGYYYTDIEKSIGYGEGEEEPESVLIGARGYFR